VLKEVDALPLCNVIWLSLKQLDALVLRRGWWQGWWRRLEARHWDGRRWRALLLLLGLRRLRRWRSKKVSLRGWRQ
jgi:hypothetical protein